MGRIHISHQAIDPHIYPHIYSLYILSRVGQQARFPVRTFYYIQSFYSDKVTSSRSFYSSNTYFISCSPHQLAYLLSISYTHKIRVSESSVTTSNGIREGRLVWSLIHIDTGPLNYSTYGGQLVFGQFYSGTLINRGIAEIALTSSL